MYTPKCQTCEIEHAGHIRGYYIRLSPIALPLRPIALQPKEKNCLVSILDPKIEILFLRSLSLSPPNEINPRTKIRKANSFQFIFSLRMTQRRGLRFRKQKIQRNSWERKWKVTRLQIRVFRPRTAARLCVLLKLSTGMTNGYVWWYRGKAPGNEVPQVLLQLAENLGISLFDSKTPIPATWLWSDISSLSHCRISTSIGCGVSPIFSLLC